MLRCKAAQKLAGAISMIYTSRDKERARGRERKFYNTITIIMEIFIAVM